MARSDLRKLLGHGAIYALGALLARIVSFVMLPIYTRALDPAQYGVVDLLDTTAAVLVNVTAVAITYSVMRFYYDAPDEPSRSRVISTALGGLAVLGTVGVAIVWPLAPFMSSAMFHSDEYALALRLMAVTAVLYGLIEVPMTYVRALERPVMFMSISLARLALGLSFNVVFVVWMKMGVLGVVLANLLGSALTCIVLCAWTLARTGVGLSRETLFKILAFGAPFVPGSLAMLVVHNGDRYILNHYRSLDDVGVYSLGYKLGMILTYALSVPFQNVWSTRMYTVVKEPDGVATYNRVATWYVLALLFAWLGLSALAPEMVTIAASPAYATAAYIVPIIAAGYVIREIAEFWKNAFLLARRTRPLAWIQPVSAVVNLAVTWWFVTRTGPIGGAMGAAWATCATFVVLLALIVVAARKDFATRLDVRAVATGLASAAVLYAVAMKLPHVPIAVAVIIKLLLVLAFPVALLVTGAVPASDRTWVLAWVARRRGRPVAASPDVTAARTTQT